MDRPQVTSVTVAKLAGVSQSTVSRVISGGAKVRPETRRRVEDAMRSLGYVPNAVARSLITRRTQLLGLVVSNITNAFYPEIIESITANAFSRGYTVVLGNARENPKLQAAYLRLFAEQRIAGAILTSVLLGSGPLIRPLIEAGFPIVVANRYSDDLSVDSVTVNNRVGGRRATHHLIQHGRRRIAYVGGRIESSTDRDRFQGYVAALTSAGLGFDPELAFHGDYTRAYGYRRTSELLGRGAPVDAIVAADDTIAAGCLDAVADAGLTVPDDVAVVGFDDIPMSSLRSVSLTTVSSAAALMGRKAVGMLLDRIVDGYEGEVRHVDVRADLIIRRSCGCHPLPRDPAAGSATHRPQRPGRPEPPILPTPASAP